MSSLMRAHGWAGNPGRCMHIPRKSGRKLSGVVGVPHVTLTQDTRLLGLERGGSLE